MARFFACLITLILLLPSQAAATMLVDLQSSEGTLSARLIINGDTVLPDDKGQPQLTAADQLLSTLTVTAPEEMTVTMPSFSGLSYGDFTLVEQGEVTTKRTANGLEYKRLWRIEPYNPGTYKLPELLVTGHQGTMTTELILPRPELTVQEIKANGEDLDDILPPQAPRALITKTMAMAALLLIILVVALWIIIRLKNKGPKPLPPKERALAEMALLTDLPPRDHIEKLAFILRCYLTSRFNLQCLEQTYDEYSPAIAACKEIPRTSRDIFLAALKRCDLIKFSNIDPEPREVKTTANIIKDALAACPLANLDDNTCGRW